MTTTNSRKKSRILFTSNYNNGDGGYTPSRRFNLDQRINYRATEVPHHIENFWVKPFISDESHQARKDRYEVRMLEKGLRPYGYPEHLFEEYLRDIESEEHTARCEAKNEWMYAF